MLLAVVPHCFYSLSHLLFVFILQIIVKLRMVGTTNIEKITKSMKMVSAAKLRGDQSRLAAAVPFAVCRRSRIMYTSLFRGDLIY
jgi:hypothetical protein